MQSTTVNCIFLLFFATFFIFNSNVLVSAKNRSWLIFIGSSGLWKDNMAQVFMTGVLSTPNTLHTLFGVCGTPECYSVLACRWRATHF